MSGCYHGGRPFHALGRSPLLNLILPISFERSIKLFSSFFHLGLHPKFANFIAELF
jgi:hypothetical protein